MEKIEVVNEYQQKPFFEREGSESANGFLIYAWLYIVLPDPQVREIFTCLRNVAIARIESVTRCSYLHPPPIGCPLIISWSFFGRASCLDETGTKNGYSAATAVCMAV
jgi:hypothetical protein